MQKLKPSKHNCTVLQAIFTIKLSLPIFYTTALTNTLKCLKNQIKLLTFVCNFFSQSILPRTTHFPTFQCKDHGGISRLRCSLQMVETYPRLWCYFLLLGSSPSFRGNLEDSPADARSSPCSPSYFVLFIHSLKQIDHLYILKRQSTLILF